MYKLILRVLALFYIAQIILCHMVKKDDKLLLSPVELIDLVREEYHKNKLPPVSEYSTEAPFEQGDNEDQIQNNSYSDSEEISDDETLKNRKVWSRWSKWGECSVTCGSGTISRQRVCVAGRCANGEREEQRRPCARMPCLTVDSNITDELRELE